MKFPPLIKSNRGQRGAVLVVALLMLVVSTLLVISLMKTSVLELKIGGANHVYANNFANAETAIAKFIADNSGRFAPGFLSLASSSGGVILSPPTGLVGGTVTLTATQTSCYLETTGIYGVLFDITATASGTLAGSTVRMHQGMLTTAKTCTQNLCAGTSHDCNSTCKSRSGHDASNTGHDKKGRDCNKSCDITGKDKFGKDCTMKDNTAATKVYWYVESEQ